MYSTSYLTTFKFTGIVVLALATLQPVQANEMKNLPNSTGTPFSMVASPTEVAIAARELTEAASNTIRTWPLTTLVTAAPSNYPSQKPASALFAAQTTVVTPAVTPTKLSYISSDTQNQTLSTESEDNDSDNTNHTEVVVGFLIGTFFIICAIGSIASILWRRWLERRAYKQAKQDEEAYQEISAFISYQPVHREFAVYRPFSSQPLHGGNAFETRVTSAA